MNRLTDNDQHFGPFTYAKVDWKPIRIVLSSGGDEENETSNNLTIYMFGYVLRINLPNIIQDYKIKRIANWDAATIQRLGRDYYYEIYPRKYGFCLMEGHLNLLYGAQTMDSSTEKSKGWFLPWTQWRFIRYSLFDDKGNPFYTSIGGHGDYEVKKTCPTVDFLFEDYDGLTIIVKTKIEEREWAFGEGWFKWLSFFRKNLIRRSLDLDFSEEVGPEKGSWKGGTTGHGIDMLPNETHEQAFKRYCELEHSAKGRKYKIEFITKIT